MTPNNTGNCQSEFQYFANLIQSISTNLEHTDQVYIIKTWVSAKIELVLLRCFSLLNPFIFTGISRSSRHKRSASGAQRAHYRKKRKFELGRQPASTKLGAKRVHTVRVRGGNLKYRALRLEGGNFAWGSEHVTRKTRIISVVCHFLYYCPNALSTADIGLQCIKQRTCSNQHTCQGCYYSS